jgi:hypothetical protein
MNNEKFVGYFIIGTKTQEDAEQGKGLILWTQDKPSWLHKFYNKLFLGIRWVDKENYAPPLVSVAAEDVTTKVVMPKQRIYKKKDNGSVQERRNTKISSRNNSEQA